MVIDLLQLGVVGAAAADGGVDASAAAAEGALDLRGGIRRRGGGGDPFLREGAVRVQRGEQVDCFLEEVDYFLLRRVGDVARGAEGADARPVLAPFVLPEGFVVPGLVFPVHGHVLQERGALV